MLETLAGLVSSTAPVEEKGLLFLGVLFFVAALTFIPRPPVCMLGGLLFGPAAFPVGLVGSTLGAVAAFLLSRHLFRSRFARIAGRRPTLKVIVEAIDVEGWRLVGLLRLASPVPGSASNYLFGLSGIPIWPYTAATLLGSAPQMLAFVYLGMAGRIALDPQSVSTAKLAFTLAGGILLLLALWIVARRVRSMLSDRLATPAA